jgi:hypothetical protein
MADNINNEKLDQYNDSLRESLDLSKMLSSNIVALAGSMAKVNMEGLKTLSGLKEIGKDIQKTINLTDKLRAGKLKEKEVNFQIAKLQEDYNRYISDTENGLNNIYSITQRQADLQQQISDDANKKLRLEGEINRETTLNISLNQQLVNKLQAIANASIQHKQGLKDEAAILRQEISSSNSVLNIKEKQISQTDKLIDKSQKEIDQIGNILYAHDRLIDSYADEIEKNEALVKSLKEQGLLSRLNSKNIDNMSSGLKDIKNLLGPFAAIFEFIKKIAFSASDQVVRIQKGLVASKEEAYALRQGFNDAAVASGDIAVNTERMVVANTELGKQLGFNSRFSNDMNIQFIKLTKQLGISEEAAGGLAKLTKASGREFKDVKNTVYQTTQALSSQNGIQIDQKEVMEEVGKITGQTLAMLKGNPQALTEAVVQAKLLGTTLESAKKSGAALLDFESSIENELQAELITGRQFNLERARSAALTGDLVTEMKELANQGIDFNNYSNMNVIAQQKIADMMGKTTDELTDQLLKQQYLGMSREQIVAMSGEEVANRVEALNAQDKFNLAMEKMQDIVGKIVGGPLGQFADMIASLLDNSAVLYGIMTAIAAISFTKLIVGLAAAAAESGLLAISTATWSSILSFGAAAIIAVGAIAAVAAAMKSGQQDIEPAGDMFSSKGKTLVAPKEGGLFSLSDNDQFAAHPQLGDMINNRPQQTAVVQDNSAVVNAITQLGNTMTSVKEGVAQLYNKKTDIYMGSSKVGTGLTIDNYNLA